MVPQWTWLPRWRTASYHLHKYVILDSKYTVILLLLCPAPLTHKKPQRCTKVHCMSPVGCKDRLIWKRFCRISCLCDFCGCSCGCCLKTLISLGFCCALQKNIFYLSGHMKATWGIFNISGLIVFFNWDLVVLEWDS